MKSVFLSALPIVLTFLLLTAQQALGTTLKGFDKKLGSILKPALNESTTDSHRSKAEQASPIRTVSFKPKVSLKTYFLTAEEALLKYEAAQANCNHYREYRVLKDVTGDKVFLISKFSTDLSTAREEPDEDDDWDPILALENSEDENEEDCEEHFPKMIVSEEHQESLSDDSSKPLGKYEFYQVPLSSLEESAVDAVEQGHNDEQKEPKEADNLPKQKQTETSRFEFNKREAEEILDEMFCELFLAADDILSGHESS